MPERQSIQDVIARLRNPAIRMAMDAGVVRLLEDAARALSEQERAIGALEQACLMLDDRITAMEVEAGIRRPDIRH